MFQNEVSKLSIKFFDGIWRSRSFGNFSLLDDPIKSVDVGYQYFDH